VREAAEISLESLDSRFENKLKRGYWVMPFPFLPVTPSEVEEPLFTIAKKNPKVLLLA
jgi:hypothetical protein